MSSNLVFLQDANQDAIYRFQILTNLWIELKLCGVKKVQKNKIKKSIKKGR